MTFTDELLAALDRHLGGRTDRQLAVELGRVQPQVNQYCRRLVEQGLVVRDDTAQPILNRLNPHRRSAQAAGAAKPATISDSTAELFWEGNVQGAVVRHLAALGATTRRLADTARRARGTDIVAEIDGMTIHVEVKGWPSKSYAEPARAGDVKPTHPTNQAAHWFAGALYSTLRLREQYRADRVAMAFPDLPRYRSLAEAVVSTLQAMRVEVFFVRQDRSVAQ